MRDPEGLDDPALIAEIEAEFAELTRDLARISTTHGMRGPRRAELLEALRTSWRARIVQKTQDRPAWRERLDEVLDKAVDRLLEDGLVENPDGSVGFAIRGDTLTSEGGPVLRGLLDGFAHMLTERFPVPPPTAPANPMQSLIGGLSQVLAGALKTAVSAHGTRGTQLPGGVDVKVASTTQVTSPVSTTLEFSADQDFQTTLAFSSRAPTPTEPTPPAASAQPPGATAPPEPSPQVHGQVLPAASLFFQQLMAGFGQAVRTAVTAAATPPMPSRPAPVSAETPTSADSPADARPAPTQTPPLAPNPMANIGTLLGAVLQKALAPATPAVSSVPTAPPVTAPGASAATPGPTPMPEAAPTPTPEAAPTPTPETPATDAPPATLTIPEAQAQGAKPAALQVDLAGLLQSLLGNLKKP
jgi:hypothetical protein